MRAGSVPAGGWGDLARSPQPWSRRLGRDQFDDPHDAGLVALVGVGLYIADRAEVDVAGLQGERLLSLDFGIKRRTLDFGYVHGLGRVRAELRSGLESDFHEQRLRE